MLTLSLLRHAKSSWDDPALDDFDRPLAPRGLAAAPAIGRWMVRNGVRPDAVIASPAARARETWELVAKALAAPIPVTFDEALYMASPRTLLDIARGVRGVAGHLLLVGHNPGLHAFATALVDEGPAAARARLDDKLPTAGLVVVALPAARFADVRPGTGRLVHFVTPRTLEK